PVAAREATPRAATSRAAASPGTYRGRVVPAQAAKRAAGIRHATRTHHTLGLGHRVGPTSPRALRTASRTGRLATNSPLIATPSPVSVGAFDGLNQTDALGAEPPDPWIAASSTHLLQSVNEAIRITSRSGTLIQTIPTWAFFALDPSEFDSDPRIVYDAAHARWVGVLLSYQGDLSANFLNVAVSESSDPSGAWDVYAYYYSDLAGDPTLPDYPGLASSSDKVVLTANEFDTSESFVGSSILVLRWSDLMTPSAPGFAVQPALWTTADPAVFTIRPAQVLSASPDVHLIAEDASGGPSNGDVLYGKLTGTAPATPAWADLTTGTLGVSAFTTPPAPRQPDAPATITTAVDERPTDAVWRANHLYFVSTYKQSYDDGATFNDGARVTELITSTVPMSKPQDVVFGANGVDAFMPGIGVSTAGTPFVVYSQSSPTQYISTRAAAFAGGVWSSPITLATATNAYNGTRWGDYVGVTSDPAGSGAVFQADQYPAADGTWATRVSRLVLDTTPPTITTPIQSLIINTTLSQTVPVRITWSASDAGSGISKSRVEANQFSTSFRPWTTTGGTGVTRNEWWKIFDDTTPTSYQYRVTAYDAAGNSSTPASSSRLTPNVYDQTNSVTYSGTWHTSSSTVYAGGSVRYSSTAGSSATFLFSGRSVGFVTYKSSTRGKVNVYLDNVLKTTLTLTSATAKARVLAYTTSFPTTGTHRVKLVVSSGRVDIDAFVVLK
ncbi:MAG: hypothetical protein ACJ77N_15705, partial [Chloroflexota bacterium]